MTDENNNENQNQAAEIEQLRADLANERQDKSVLMSMLGGQNRRCLELEDQREKLMDQLERAARFDAFETAIDMLRRTAHDPGAARNYVQCELVWEHALAPTLPFKRACIAFVRDGAKNPAELVRDALKAKEEVVNIALELLDQLEDRESAARPDIRRRLGELLLTPEANPPLGELPKKH